MQNATRKIKRFLFNFLKGNTNYNIIFANIFSTPIGLILQTAFLKMVL